MHSMHTYFMGERCLYLVVLNARQNEEPEPWLDLVRQYGKKSRVLVVLNQIDNAENAALDEKKLLREYEGVFPHLSFHAISCKDGRGFAEFSRALLHQVRQSEACNQKFPAGWDRVRKQLRDMSMAGKPVNYISMREYEAMCAGAVEDPTSGPPCCHGCTT